MTLRAAVGYYLSFSALICPLQGTPDHEAYVSAEPPAKGQNPWLPRADEHQEWASGPEAPPGEGAQAPHSVLVLSRPSCPDRTHVSPAHLSPDCASPRLDTASRQFGKSRRLRRRPEFQKVFDGGQRIRGRFLTLLFATSQTSTSRLGIVASRKLGDSVRRNRAKRLIREIFRRTPQPDGLTGVDIVVIPRVELFGAAYANLEEDYRSAYARAVARVTRK